MMLHWILPWKALFLRVRVAILLILMNHLIFLLHTCAGQWSLKSSLLSSFQSTSKRTFSKADRMSRLIEALEKFPIPSAFVKDKESPNHRPEGPVILAAAMSPDLGRSDAKMFTVTARQHGYEGDIVISVLPENQPRFMEVIRFSETISYTVKLFCSGEHTDKVCSITETGPKLSINMLRFYMYQWWARMYDPDALIMISDFRDVFFQGNPFTYKAYEWAPPVAQMVVFQEAYPNKIIYRCPFNSQWIAKCYGKEGLRRVASNTVSCSGVSIGTRDAILTYAHLITVQLDPRARYGRNTTRDNLGCLSLGMDQGFHNWLVYSGQLEKYMNIKIYQQGEGPVNTVGAFFGKRAILQYSLKDWTILRGEPPNQYIHNWNGDKSPVVHQADRFLGKGQVFEAGFNVTLAVSAKATRACCPDT